MPDLDPSYLELAGICQALLHEVTGAESVRADASMATEMLGRVPPLRVVVFGEYGRGKSTLLSALAQRRLFPHLPGDTTSVATILSWGPDEGAIVSYAEPGGSQSQKEIGLDQVQRYVTEIGNRSVGELVMSVGIRAPLPSLAWGLEFVDTPGVNSRIPIHNVITQQYLERASAVLFVASVDRPLSALELEAFGTVAETGVPIIAVLTKTDVLDPEELLQSATERLSGRLGRPLEVLPVSAEMALDGQKAHDIAREELSGVPDLYQAIADLGASKRAWYALYGSAENPGEERASPVALLAAALATLRLTATGELETIRRAERDQEAFSQAIAEAQAKLDSLDYATGELRRTVRSRANAKVAEMQQKISDLCGTMVLQSKMDLAMDRLPATPEAYQQRLVEGLGGIANWADSALDQFFVTAVAEARKLTDSELIYAPGSAPELTPAVTDPASGTENRTRISFSVVSRGLAGSKAMAVYGSAVGLTIGSLVGLGPGSALGGAIGALIGYAAGAILGTRDALSEDRQAEVRKVALVAEPLIVDAGNRISAWLAETAPAETDRLSSAIDELINQRRALLAGQREQAKKNEADPAKRAGRIAELANQLQLLDKLDASLAQASERLQQVLMEGK